MKRIVYLLALLLLLSDAKGAQPTNQALQYIYSKNLLRNPGAEEGKYGWTASAGTFGINTTPSNVSSGRAAFSWDASATGQTLSNSASANMRDGGQCFARVRYKTTETTVPYVMEVFNGSDIYATVTLTGTSSGYTSAETSFPCSNTGTHRLRVRTSSSAGDPAIIYLDDFYLGYDMNWTILAAGGQLAGRSVIANTSNCTWSRTAGAGIGAFSTDADCPGPTVGSALIGTWSTTDADLPQQTITNLPPGEYTLIVTTNITNATNNGYSCYVLTDGSTTSGSACGNFPTATNVTPATLVGHWTYSTTQSSRTFAVHASGVTGNAQIDNASGSQNTTFTLYWTPNSTITAARLDSTGWYVDANIGGANPTLGGLSQSSYIGIENGSLTLTQNSGSATAWIPCSSTNDSSGTTCSAGNESVGVSFTPPRTGDYLACASFGHYMSTGTGSMNGTVDAAFQIVETPNAAQTISQQGKSRVPSTLISTIAVVHPLRVCGNFTFNSVGRKTLRLMYEQVISGTVSNNELMADQASTVGQRDIHWEVYPINRNASVIIPEAVTSNNTSRERIERANVAATCGASPCTIASQSGSWLSSITRLGTGDYQLNFAAGIFSSTPSCVIMPINTAVNLLSPNVGSRTRSSTQWGFFAVNAAAGAVDIGFDVICMGTR